MFCEWHRQYHMMVKDLGGVFFTRVELTGQSKSKMYAAAIYNGRQRSVAVGKELTFLIPPQYLNISWKTRVSLSGHRKMFTFDVMVDHSNRSQFSRWSQ